MESKNAVQSANVCTLNSKARCGLDQRRNEATQISCNPLVNFERKPSPITTPSPNQRQTFGFSVAVQKRFMAHAQKNRLGASMVISKDPTAIIGMTLAKMIVQNAVRESSRRLARRMSC